MVVIGLLVVVIVLQLATYGCVMPRRGSEPPKPELPRMDSLDATERAALTMLRGAAEELRAAALSLQVAAAHLKDEPGKGYRASRAHVAAKRALAASEAYRGA